MSLQAYFKGHFIMRNAENGTKMAGLAQTTNDAMSMGYKDDTKVNQVKDAGGVTRTLVKDMNEFTLNLTLTPGIGWAAATAQAAVDAYGGTTRIQIGDDIILTGCIDTNFNVATHTGFISAISKSLKSEDNMSVDVTVTVLQTAAGGTLDFTTTGWAALA